MSILELQDLVRASQFEEGEAQQKVLARVREVWQRICARLGCEMESCEKCTDRDNPLYFMAYPLTDKKEVSSDIPR